MPHPLADRAAAPTEAAVPGPHLGLRWRALSDADAATVHALLERCEAVDEPIARTSRQAVEEMLDRPATGMRADSLGGFDDAGQLRAAAFVHAPPGDESTARVYIAASIDPTWRTRGVGRALLEWQDGRARQILAGLRPELPGRIAAYVDEHLADRRRLYAAAGFSPKRTYREMRRPATEDPQPAPLPEGIEIREWSSQLDDAVRAAHNEAFRDHWGSEPLTAESWARALGPVAPAWSMVAVDTTSGEVAGYALTARHEHRWTSLGHSEGFIELLGVRRPYRGSGLAKALLGAVCAALHRDGVDVVALDVDVENPSGAKHLYERLGYRPEGARILYTIEL